ncbi:MAG: hypothetical protein WA418_00300 [Bradyrhizobium sp.]
MRIRTAPACRSRVHHHKAGRAEKLISRATSITSPLSSPARKNILLSFFRIQYIFTPSRLDTRGASRSSRTLRRDAVGVSMLQRGVILRRRTAAMRTVKSRGPDTPMLVSRVMRDKRIARTVAKKPGAPGSARSSRQNHRAGNAGMPRLNLWYLPPAFFSAGGPWVRPAPGIPRALYLEEGGIFHPSDARTRRENAIVCDAAQLTDHETRERIASRLQPPFNDSHGLPLRCRAKRRQTKPDPNRRRSDERKSRDVDAASGL